MSIFPSDITDVHTHVARTPHAIISVGPDDERPGGYYYSVGIHPWDTAADSAELERRLDAVREAVRDEAVLAVGECGIDRLRGGDAATQRRLFEAQARIAEECGKPLIIHVVRAIDDIIAIRRRLRPTVPWIIHGFRGKPEQARQLTALGFHLSAGPRTPAATLAAIPPDRLLRESDAQ